MELPYTGTWKDAADAFLAAQTSVGAVLTAIVWRRPTKPLASSVTLLAAIWLAVLAPVMDDALTFIGEKVPGGSTLLVLHVAAALCTVAMSLNRPRWLGAVSLVGQLFLLWASGKLVDHDRELAALNLFWFAAMLGAHLRINFPAERPREPVGPTQSYVRQDLVLFGVATTLALLVGHFVLERACDSADEWAYNWQALVFSRLKAYAAIPPCPEPHRAHWVFYYNGRAFAQYLPGWPFVMIPFARLGIAWVASPVAFGALIVGVARIGRRAAGEAAGVIAAFSTMLGAATLFNAGSRYCHIFVAACFVWAIEAVCATRIDSSRRAQWGWGTVLGVSTGLMLCTRPQDAGLCCFGLFLHFVYGLFARRIGVRVLFGAALPFTAICGLTAIILRLQIGVWFKTGYDVAQEIYWWAKPLYDIPARDAWKYGIPFMTAAYCFFPAAPALAVAGLLVLGRRLAFIFATATVLHLSLYTAVVFGRYRDFGYGPRYHLILVVPMAIGAGVLLAPLWNDYRARLRAPILGTREGPLALAMAAFVVGVVRIAPLMYPFAHEMLHQRNAIFRAIQRDGLQNAVVTVRQGDTGGGPLLDAQNDPFDPHPAVLVLGPDDQMCTRALYPDRTFYQARGRDEVTLTPY